MITLKEVLIIHELAIEKFGYQSLLAGHVIDYLGEAYIDLFKQPEQPPQQEEAEE